MKNIKNKSLKLHIPSNSNNYSNNKKKINQNNKMIDNSKY